MSTIARQKEGDMSHGEEFLTIQELANLLNVSRGTLNKWRRNEVGPPELKVDNTVRFRRSDVDQWVEMMMGTAEIS